MDKKIAVRLYSENTSSMAKDLLNVFKRYLGTKGKKMPNKPFRNAIMDTQLHSTLWNWNEHRNIRGHKVWSPFIAVLDETAEKEFVGQLIDGWEGFMETNDSCPNNDVVYITGADYDICAAGIRDVLKKYNEKYKAHPKMAELREKLLKAGRCLKDNGVEKDEVFNVLQALSYILLGIEIEEVLSEQDFE